MWRGRVLVAAAVAAALAGPAYSVQLDCERVDARDAKSTVKYGGKELKKLETGVDAQVKSACTPWQDALDYWKYGDYYPLWDSKTAKFSEKDKNQFATSHNFYNIRRMQCTKRVDRGKPPVVGYFAYHFVAAEKPKDNESRGTATLDLLCTTTDGREKGVGTAMLDEAAKEISGTFLPEQFFRLELVAVKGAEPFYNRFQLSCDEFAAGKMYSGRLTMGQKKGEPAQVRLRAAYHTDEANGTCHPVTFACVIGDAYQQAIKNKKLMTLEEAKAAGYHDCEAGNAEPIEFSKIR
jgi:hypothetical protein